MTGPEGVKSIDRTAEGGKIWRRKKNKLGRGCGWDDAGEKRAVKVKQIKVLNAQNGSKKE